VDGIKRTNRSASQKTSSAVAHRTVQKSTTLNRRFVKKPVAKQVKIVPETSVRKQTVSGVTAASVQRQRSGAAMIKRGKRVQLSPIAKQGAAKQTATKQAVAKQAAQPVAKSAQAKAAEELLVKRANPRTEARVSESAVAKAARARATARKQQSQQVYMSSQEMKERAISNALKKISAMDKAEAKKCSAQAKCEKQRGHLFAALSFAVLSVALLGYLVYLNLPDLSVRVAAMNSGIENAYPSYVPMNYRLQGLAKEDNGTITMNFTRSDGGKFTMTEKKSSWDSSALLNNYVSDNWGSDYTVAKGQGLTIYISGSNAVWVNGGVMYLIESEGDSLTTDDLHDIAISL